MLGHFNQNDTGAQKDSTGDFTNIINLDPGRKYYIYTSDGIHQVSLARWIAHELGHSVEGDEDDGTDNMNNTNKNENPIVDELGLPPRTSYIESPPAGRPA